MKKNYNIAIVGLGQVGLYLYNELKIKKKDIETKTGKQIKIVAISAKNKNKKRKFKIDKKIFYSNPLNIFKNKIDILIECIGLSDGISKSIVEKALNKKIHVITPNKALISKHGDKLSEIAEKKKVNLEFEASVGGGIPILRTIKEGLATNKISKVYGILNGTCNYILTLMSKGIDFKKALHMAQKEGFAEADPTLDINGKDTAHKVSVLCQTCFDLNLDIDQIYTQGIENISSYDIDVANNLGYEIKLLGISRIINKKLDSRVHPTLISKKNPLSNVKNEFNAVLVNSNNLGPYMGYGYGAGMLPTATAIVSDIIRASNLNLDNNFNKDGVKIELKKFEDIKSKFYLRIMIKDAPGNLGKVTSILGKFRINIDKVIQNKKALKSRTIPVIILTKSLELKTLNKALKDITKKKLIHKESLIIPVEDLV